MKISIQKKKTAGAVLLAFLSESSKEELPRYLNNYKNQIQALFKDNVFKGKLKTSFFLPLQSADYSYLLLIGIGKEKSFDYEGIRQCSARAYKELKSRSQETADILAESLLTKNTDDWEKLCQSLSEGMILTSYSCNEFQKKKKEKPKCPEHLFLLLSSEADESSAEKGLKTGQVLGEAVNFSRKLGNYPGNFMTPSILAQSVEREMQNTKINTTIWDKKRIEKEKMGGLLGVSLGSSQEPRFIIMEYKGGKSSQRPIILVGKGLTFDSGGISLKPSSAMDEMKFDMCGAATVIGTMLAIEKLGLKLNVMGLVPSSENMPGQSANKPGDILIARNGKSMEILNTDAEGRLILADALSYACEQKPLVIFDAATLTGAVLVSLGNIFTGFFTKNKQLVEKVHKAGQKTGEKVWHLPLTEEHRRDIKSVFADVANISSHRGAGSSTAAAFLENFVEKDIPWVHFDIAGTAWNVHNRLEYCVNKMASGVMVRTFVELVRSYESDV